MINLDSLIQEIKDLGDIETITHPPIVRQKSRDFFWYSPVLKRQLDEVMADLVVVPKTEQEVVSTIQACYQHQVPVTVRAGGTGNYGQAMPLQGGLVLDLSEMNKIKSIAPGRVVTEPGIRILELDRATQAHSGQEQRMHPSTRELATIGGFIAGGSSGIGSVTWGLISDPGNVLGVKVVTMEAEPQILTLRGDEINKVAHAYGTNGVIVEVEMPLAPAYDWREFVIGFDDFMAGVHYAHDLCAHTGILKKLVAPIAAPVGQQYFKPLKDYLPEGQSLVMVMVAPHSEEAFMDLTHRHGGNVLYKRTDQDDRLPPIYEFTWNHTTLQALKTDRNITYLQSLFPPGDHLERVEHFYRYFGDEVPMHLEFVRFQGAIACFGLQLVRFTSEGRLKEIIEYHEANGVPIFNPHAYTIEEGGMKQVDHAQLNFKRRADPQGLLNPGKMIAWNNPEYDGRRSTVLFK
ncbi:MAG: FAD-binding oxidoreductase [Cyanophyceae cyanobacterium]